MNNEQLKKLHKQKNTKAINENLYKANIKLVDMNRYLKMDIEKLQQRLKEDYAKEKYLVDKYTRQLTDEYKNTEYQCKEKERLNNIINELEKALKDNIDMCDGFIDTATSDLQELGARHNGKTYYQTILLENKIALKIYQKELNKIKELKRRGKE